jgi:hypothetical protein
MSSPQAASSLGNISESALLVKGNTLGAPPARQSRGRAFILSVGPGGKCLVSCMLPARLGSIHQNRYSLYPIVLRNFPRFSISVSVSTPFGE